MDIWVLGSKYENLAVIDTFSSLTWTVRYNLCDDFVLEMPFTNGILDILKIGNYLTISDSDRYMIIEKISILTDSDDGTVNFTIEGRGLESKLDRRIVWSNTKISGNPQVSIKNIFTNNLLSGAATNRRVADFRFIDSTDNRIVSKNFESEFFGEDLLEVIEHICGYEDLGFRCLPDGDGGMKFELYLGLDRSYDQNERPYVVFSRDFDNLLSSSYAESELNHKTVALATGEFDEQIITSEVIKEKVTGWDRREIKIEPTDISTTDSSGEKITLAEYRTAITNKAQTELKTYAKDVVYSGEVNSVLQYQYPNDYQLGDIVQVKNEFGNETKARVEEIVISYDSNGKLVTPSFVGLEDDEEGS